MIVVSDTTPLLTLFKIGRIDVLNKLYNSVHIPFAVFEELTRNTEYPEEAEYFRNCPFLEVHSDLSADRVSCIKCGMTFRQVGGVSPGVAPERVRGRLQCGV